MRALLTIPATMALASLWRWLRRFYVLALMLEGLSLLRNLAPGVFPVIVPRGSSDALAPTALSGTTEAQTITADTPRLAQPSTPSVSIVVPARNEETNISACLRSLLAQTARDHPIEIIAVDDASTDATSHILDDLAATHTEQAPQELSGQATLRVIHLSAKPPDWAGKPHALHAGASAAQGRWLLFTDADTRWCPGAVEALVAFAEAVDADLVSAMPTLILPTLTERIVVPALLLTLLLTTQPIDVRNPRRRAAGANGQCLLVRRAAYEAIGGFAHPELRRALLDDSSLARVIKRAGYHLQVARGDQLLTVRMYPSLSDAWQGWTRSLGATLQLYPRSVGTALTTIVMLWLLSPYLLLASGLRSILKNTRGTQGQGSCQRDGRRVYDYSARRSAWKAFLSGIVALGITLAMFAWAVRGATLPIRYALLHPIGVTLEVVLLAQAWWGRMRGKPVVWKERAYAPSATPNTYPMPTLPDIQPHLNDS